MKALGLLRTLIFIISIIICNNAFGEKRVALIIGNEVYPDSHFDNLRTCVNDAYLINSTLKNLPSGFETIVETNCDQKAMAKAFSQFNNLSKNADVAVFFFSGHAKNIGGELYLIPSNTVFESDIQRSELVSIADIRDIMEKNAQLSLLFIDACRDGAHSKVKGTTKGRTTPSIGNTSNKPKGSMVFYATQYGDKATIGNGSISPFTQVLAEHLPDGDEFMTVWQNIKDEVPTIAENQYPDQEDFYLNSFWFNRMGSKIVAPAVNPIDNPDKYRYITINTNVPNSKIHIYGSTFKSGIPIPFEKGKTYIYTISMDGYQPYSGRINTNSAPDVVNANLVLAEHATIKIYSNKEALVYLDNKHIGKVYPSEPLNISTLSGNRELKLSANGYYPASRLLEIKPGANSAHFTLSKEYPPFWQWDGYNETHFLSYHFSPKYQIGLSYMYRPDNSRWSFGATLAISPGLFRNVGVQAYSYSYVDTDRTYTVDENGSQLTYREQTKYQFLDGDHYSEELDPYNEAKKYNANFLGLVNVGYNICNGVMMEAGIGAGHHQDYIQMPSLYIKGVTTTTNLATGQEVREPTVEYIKQAGSKWFKENSKWSPAARIGARFFIPLDDWDNNFITLGSGYTFLFTNFKQSSWDVNIGYVWSF